MEETEEISELENRTEAIAQSSKRENRWGRKTTRSSGTCLTTTEYLPFMSPEPQKENKGRTENDLQEILQTPQIWQNT